MSLSHCPSSIASPIAQCPQGHTLPLVTLPLCPQGVGTAVLGALLALFVGEEAEASLPLEARAKLLDALAGYRQSLGAPPNPFATKQDYASEVCSPHLVLCSPHLVR